MQNVMRWLEEYALASAGLDEHEVRAATNLSEADVAQLVGGKGAVDPAANAAHIMALRELGRAGRYMASEQFQETLTTAHFSHYFSDAISRAFYADYAYKAGSWTNYTYADSAPDFRDVDRFRMTEPGTLHKRREKAEAHATYIADSVVSYGVEEYSEQFDVSWRTIQNDDLGKIRDTPVRMANAARRWLDAWVSALYDNATTQAGMLALGVVYGGTGRLTALNLAIGLNAMMQRTDANGNQMNISRVNLVIPPILQIQAADILQDLLNYGGPGGNVLAQFMTNVYVDPYIAFAGANVPWYLFADPSEIPTVAVARLEGFPGPAVTMQEPDRRIISGSVPAAFGMGSFSTGDIQFDVTDVIGGWDNATYVGVTDYRGLYYSNGTTA